MLDYILSRFNSFPLQTNGLTTDNLLSRNKKEFSHYPDSDTLVIVLPGWGQNLGYWKYVKEWAQKSRYSSIFYQFPREILSDDETLTEKIFSLINRTAREDIRELKNKYKFSRCVIIAISLSSSYGSMIYKGNPDINDIILICPGNNLALNMWNGCRTQHLRRSYEKQGINSLKLKEYWQDLDSENNMPASGTNATILYGKYDQVIPYHQAKTLADTLRSNGINVNSKNYNCGHYVLLAYFLLFPGRMLNRTLRLTKNKNSVI